LFVLGPGIELLTELHDVDALGTERGTDRGGRIGLSSFTLELNIAGNLFCHVFGFFGDNVLTIIVKTPNSINQTLSMEACAGSKRTVWGGKGRGKTWNNQEEGSKGSRGSKGSKG